MDRDALALHLIDQIYRASVSEAGWQEFVGGLCESFEGSLVYLSLSTPGRPSSRRQYAAGLPEDFGGSLSRGWSELLPWNQAHAMAFSEGFISAGRAFPALAIEDTSLYRLWMVRRGLPPEWPIWFRDLSTHASPSAEIVILRRSGAGASLEFSQQDLDLGNLLVPHLRRAFAVYRELAGIEWNRRALQEVVERLRLGVVLLDSERRLIKSNGSADGTLAAHGGVRLRDGKLYGVNADDDRKLQAAIGRALANAAKSRFQYDFDEYFLFERSLEQPNLEFQVRPLLSGAPGSAASDAVVAVLIVNTDEVSTFPLQVARRLYSLTNAEAELLQLLLEGASLGQAAERRGVALNTARGQLKAIFAKTGTKRQSELVQVVLAGVETVWEAEIAGTLETPAAPLLKARGE